MEFSKADSGIRSGLRKTREVSATWPTKTMRKRTTKPTARHAGAPHEPLRAPWGCGFYCVFASLWPAMWWKSHELTGLAQSTRRG